MFSCWEMNRLCWCGAVAALLLALSVQVPAGIFVYMLGYLQLSDRFASMFPGFYLRKLMKFASDPPAGQTRFVPKTGPFLNGNLVRGLPVPAFVLDARIDWLEAEFKHRDEDVWVATYAKSGTAWVQNIVSLLRGWPGGGFGKVQVTCPWPEISYGFSPSAESLQESVEWPGYRRCHKSHWPQRDHMSLDRLPRSSKVVWVLRNAESVFASYYQHILDKYGFYRVEPDDFPGGQSWDILFDMFVNGELDWGCYFEHAASWWKVRDRPNLLLLRFGEMKEDHAGTIHKISNFIGRPADEKCLPMHDGTVACRDCDAACKAVFNRSLNQSEIEWVRSQSTFSAMKKHEETDDMMKFLGRIGWFRGSHFRSDGSKEEKLQLKPEQLARLQKRYEEVLEPLGMPRELVLSHKLP
eukprot:TRINITY_DN89457_c0_g1_i1.p1 TRINITY_DN89457_c0_g1~~TRINITY_DN89457_c0_g1_i1.p1  ORF type:complete len:410 (-),score=58.85 TRINITY_DN89457_c0_g1_i1:66-1295(-)